MYVAPSIVQNLLYMPMSGVIELPMQNNVSDELIGIADKFLAEILCPFSELKNAKAHLVEFILKVDRQRMAIFAESCKAPHRHAQLASRVIIIQRHLPESTWPQELRSDIALIGSHLLKLQRVWQRHICGNGDVDLEICTLMLKKYNLSGGEASFDIPRLRSLCHCDEELMMLHSDGLLPAEQRALVDNQRAFFFEALARAASSCWRRQESVSLNLPYEEWLELAPRLTSLSKSFVVYAATRNWEDPASQMMREAQLIEIFRRCFNLRQLEVYDRELLFELPALEKLEELRFMPIRASEVALPIGEVAKLARMVNLTSLALTNARFCAAIPCPEKLTKVSIHWKATDVPIAFIKRCKVLESLEVNGAELFDLGLLVTPELLRSLKVNNFGCSPEGLHRFRNLMIVITSLDSLMRCENAFFDLCRYVPNLKSIAVSRPWLADHAAVIAFSKRFNEWKQQHPSLSERFQIAAWT
jgi:hypothetical protein